LAAEQERAVTEKWLPELKTGVLNAQQSLEACKYVWGLVSYCCYCYKIDIPSNSAENFWNDLMQLLLSMFYLHILLYKKLHHNCSV